MYIRVQASFQITVFSRYMSRSGITRSQRLFSVFQGTSLLFSAFLVVQMVKNPPAMWETWVQSLGWGDPLEKGKATHSSILAWKIPWTV